jgi:leader peptidase (prepilin peptidase)/N-methyltransferase
LSLPAIAQAFVLALLIGAAAPHIVRRFAPDARMRWWLTVPAMLAIAAWAWFVLPPTALLPCSVVLGCGLLLLAIIDAAVFRLPDLLTFPLLAMGLAVMAWLTHGVGWSDYAIGAVAGFALFFAIGWIFERITGRDGLGLGDAKLMAVAGAWLGWQNLPSVVLIAAIGGLLIYLVSTVRHGAATARAQPIAFGVPLCLAIWLTWLYGPLT